MLTLRSYQQELKAGVLKAWAEGAKVVCMQSGTGTGKTRVMESLADDVQDEAGCAMAHRRELVGQMSCALASAGISHDIIAPKNVREIIVKKHFRLFGRTTYNPNGKWKVASVDTINARNDLGIWANQVRYVFQDEGHHTLRHNKWGKAFNRFPNCIRGLLPTATPNRADKKGLGSWADGIADALVEGPPLRWVIDNGYLTDYDFHVVNPSDMNLAAVNITESGDFNPKQLAEAVKKSRSIIGDVVSTYLAHAKGLLGVTFAVDIEHAQLITDAFNRAGVPAVMVHSGSTDDERDSAIQRLEAREIWQIVNVDLFGEGFDLPAIECVSLARPTMSWPLYAQQVGRVLRLNISSFLTGIWDTLTVDMRKQLIAKSSKPRGLVFDHAGNLWRHEGPPDRPQVWSLDGGKRARRAGDEIPLRNCAKCHKNYFAIETKCPYCGEPMPEPDPSGGAIAVDGNLYKLTPEMLAILRGEVWHVWGDAKVPYDKPELAGVVRWNHDNRKKASYALKRVMELWAGSYPEVSDEVNHKRFFFLFGIDVLAALVLSERDSINLRGKIERQMSDRGIVINQQPEYA